MINLLNIFSILKNKIYKKFVIILRYLIKKQKQLYSILCYFKPHLNKTETKKQINLIINLIKKTNIKNKKNKKNE